MSLYNFYRPLGYEEVVGQDGIVESLVNMVALNKVVSTLLFYGPRGTGKTTCARIFAKALNCENPVRPGVPCCQCDSCIDITNDQSLNVIEIDAASSTGVDNMRDLKASANLVGASGKWKVYIIDECHMLSKAAQNSALKMLEEAPDKTVFILATTELHKVEGTIISRSLRFDFRPVTIDSIVKRLSYIAGKEEVETEEAALAMIAKIAQGGVRDSISIFERVSLENSKKVLVKGVVRSLGIAPTDIIIRLGDVIKGDYKASIEVAGEVVERGYDIYQFLMSAIDYYRGVLMSKLSMGQMLKVEAIMKSNMDDISGMVSQEQITNAIAMVEEAVSKYKYTEDKQILLELSLYKIADKYKKKEVSVVNNNVNIDKDMILRLVQEEVNRRVGLQSVETKPVVVQPEVKIESRPDTVNSPNKAEIQPIENTSAVMFEYLMGNWKRFIEILKNNDAMIATVVEMTTPVSFDNNMLLLRFPEGSFYLEIFNSQMINDTSRILSSCMGVICSVKGIGQPESPKPCCDTVDSPNKTGRGSLEMRFEPISNVGAPVNFVSQPDIQSVENNQPVIFNAPVIEARGGESNGNGFVSETQSFLIAPNYVKNVIVQDSNYSVVDDEPKFSKDDEVDMNMIEIMFP